MRHAFRGTFLIVLALGASGCATMAAHQAEQAKWQALADQATHALGKSEVSILIVAGTVGNAGSTSCAQGTITVGNEGDVKWLLAHEIGHHVTNHCGMGLANEIAANSGAVKILQIWGETEEQAVRHTGNHLLNLKKRGWTLPGHDYCAEFSALRKEYPQYAPRDPDKANATCPGTGSGTLTRSGGSRCTGGPTEVPEGAR
jgi:hypothetical protein